MPTLEDYMELLADEENWQNVTNMPFNRIVGWAVRQDVTNDIHPAHLIRQFLEWVESLDRSKDE